MIVPKTDLSNNPLKKVPGYDTLYVSESGSVWDSTRGKFATVTYPNENYKDLYPSVSYKLGINKYGTVRVHRLVALTWVKNEKPDEYNVVNHLDGDKTNFHSDNLEWTDNTGNILHAGNNQLLNTYYGKARNLITGEIVAFNTMKECCDLIGARNTALSASLEFMLYGIYKDIWEIKFNRDGKKGRFRAKYPANYHILLDPKGNIEDMDRSLVELAKRHGVSKYKVECLNLKVEAFEEKGFRYIDTQLRLPSIQVMSESDNKVTVFSTQKEVQDYTGLKPHYVKSMLGSQGKLTRDGFRIRFMSKKPWPKNGGLRSKDRVVVIEYIDGRVIKARNKTHASKITSLSEKTYRHLLNPNVGTSYSPSLKAHVYYEGDTPVRKQPSKKSLRVNKTDKENKTFKTVWLKNIKTGEVKQFDGIKYCCEYLGLTSKVFENLKKNDGYVTDIHEACLSEEEPVFKHKYPARHFLVFKDGVLVSGHKNMCSLCLYLSLPSYHRDLDTIEKMANEKGFELGHTFPGKEKGNLKRY